MCPFYTYLVVVEDIGDEGASDRGAFPRSEGDLDSTAFAGGEGDKIQEGDKGLAPQIHFCSLFQAALRGPCVVGEEDREGTLLGGGSQPYVAAPCSRWASCEVTCDYRSRQNQEQNGNGALPLCW